jgi:tRNA nucleotidyltransferase/poly(A) polymerase
VGGAVRDALLARGEVLDLDVACMDAHVLAKALARRVRGALVTLDAEAQVFRVVSREKPGVQVDVARIQGADILEDLARRDFTVDAMALELFSPETPDILDPFDGKKDLRRKLIRMRCAKSFEEDPIRLLRAFRIAAQLDLKIEPKTLACARKQRGLLSKVAAERVRAELLGLLGRPDSALRLRNLDAAGLLTEVFPELEPSRACARVYYGKGGVLEHSLRVVERMDFLLSELDAAFGADIAGRIREQLAACGAAGKPELLRLAGLLHDVAKPECARKIDGRLRFFGHERAGALRVQAMLERLRCSRDEQRAAALFCEHHLRPGNLAGNETVSDKAVYRFFRDLGTFGVPQLLVCWADHASYLSPAGLAKVLRWIKEDPHHFRPRRGMDEDTAKTLHHLQVVNFLLKRYFLTPGTARPELLLDGREVMKALAIPPGPRIGQALAELEEAQACGRVKTKPQAVLFVKKIRFKETA